MGAVPGLRRHKDPDQVVAVDRGLAGPRRTCHPHPPAPRQSSTTAGAGRTRAVPVGHRLPLGRMARARRGRRRPRHRLLHTQFCSGEPNRRGPGPRRRGQTLPRPERRGPCRVADRVPHRRRTAGPGHPGQPRPRTRLRARPRRTGTPGRHPPRHRVPRHPVPNYPHWPTPATWTSHTSCCSRTPRPRGSP